MKFKYKNIFKRNVNMEDKTPDKDKSYIHIRRYKNGISDVMFRDKVYRSVSYDFDIERYRVTDYEDVFYTLIEAEDVAIDLAHTVDVKFMKKEVDAEIIEKYSYIIEKYRKLIEKLELYQKENKVIKYDSDFDVSVMIELGIRE
jgi:hypothetical protein